MRHRHPSDTPEAPPSGRLNSGGGVLVGVLRLAAGVLAFVLMLGALLVGAALALGLVAWALLRGRRPAAAMFSRRPFSTRLHRGRPDTAESPPWRGRKDRGAVIDVDVREVPEGDQPVTPLRPRG